MNNIIALKVPGVHAAQAGLRQGERVRGAPRGRARGAAVPLRLVPEVAHGCRAAAQVIIAFLVNFHSSKALVKQMRRG